MRALRWLLGLVLVLVLAISAAVLAARFRDGPTGPLPGGPLRAGELAPGPPPDWTFAAETQEIELQLESQTTSRITWIVVKDGAAYVPCSLDFPPLKTWYKGVAADGRAIVRIAGRRYPVTLVKVDDEARIAGLREAAGAKYASARRAGPGRVWFFELKPRAS
jgi:hypothetical protein